MSNKKLNVEGNLFSIGNPKDDESKNVSNFVSVSESESENEKTYKNEIRIKRKEAINYTMPMTYRLKVSTIEQIRKQARQADMGVAEYLQKVLDSVLDNIIIE
jgi:hypothetical protein